MPFPPGTFLYQQPDAGLLNDHQGQDGAKQRCPVVGLVVNRLTSVKRHLPGLPDRLQRLPDHVGTDSFVQPLFEGVLTSRLKVRETDWGNCYFPAAVRAFSTVL